MEQHDTAPEELFRRYVLGDSEALAKLIEALSPELRRFACRLGADAQLSEDIVQELWLDLLGKDLAYDVRRPLVPWLRGVVRIRVRSAQRREQRMRELVRRAWRGESDTSQGRDPSAREAEALVRDALRRLPEHYHAPLKMHLLDGLSPLEIAQRLEMPRASVRVLLHRGRALLRRRLPGGIFALLVSLMLSVRSRAASSSAAAVGIAVAVLLIAAGTNVRSQPHELESESPAIATTRAPLASEHATALELDAERTAVLDEPSLEVLVRRADGSPAANVGLVLEPLDGSDPRLHRQFARTGADGRARLERVLASPSRLSTDRGVAAMLEAGERRRELRLEGGQALRGRVVDAHGAPIANAAIWLGDVEGSRSGQVVAFSGADGGFELLDAPAGAKVAAFAEGFERTAMIAPSVVDGVAQVEFAMRAGGAEVRVLACDSSGAAIASARVFVGKCVDGQPPELARGLTPAFPPPIVGIADETGLFVARGLEPGVHPVVVRAVGHAPALVQAPIDGAETLELRVQLEPGATLRGRVVDPFGEPLAAAQVALRGADPLSVVHLTSASDGRFVAEGLSSGALSVAARAWDHGAVELDVYAPCGTTDGVELALAPQPICRGDIANEHGGPLGGFRIRMLGAPDNAYSPNSDEGETDERGEFRLAVIGGEIRRIELRAPHWPQWLVVKRSWLRESSNRLGIVVPSSAAPASWLRGELRDVSGQPLQDRRIDLVSDGGALAVRAATTDARGRFEIGPLGAGEHRLVLAHSGRADEVGPLGELGVFELEAGETRELDLKLPRTARWRCALRFADGAAPASPIASLDLAGGQAGVVSWNDIDQVVELLPGRYALHVMGDDFEWLQDFAVEIADGASAPPVPLLVRASRVRIELEELPIDVDLAAGLTVERDATGEKVERFELLEGAADRPLQCFLAHGAYAAVVRRSDGTRCERAFEVGPRGAAPERLRFDR